MKPARPTVWLRREHSLALRRIPHVKQMRIGPVAGLGCAQSSSSAYGLRRWHLSQLSRRRDQVLMFIGTQRSPRLTDSVVFLGAEP